MDEAETLLADWYNSFRPDDGREPERFVVCAGLSVLEHARSGTPVVRSSYVTEKNQVRTGGPFIQKILARYGETRTYTREGGRTTRGTVPAAEQLALGLNQLKALITASPSDQIAIIDHLQGWLAARAAEYFDQQRIQVSLEPTLPTNVAIADLLSAAGSKVGAVAQHIVGAKLSLRYRELGIEVENHSYTTADLQLGRPGDFVVGNTSFHVTVAPSPTLVEKCHQNVRNGYRVQLLVRESVLVAARQMVTMAGLDRNVGVLPIEQFVGQNVEEMGSFTQFTISEMLRELFAEYNRRVEAVETDRSLLLDVPDYLR